VEDALRCCLIVFLGHQRHQLLRFVKLLTLQQAEVAFGQALERRPDRLIALPALAVFPDLLQRSVLNWHGILP